LGLGFWVWGLGPNPQTPNPQSPIPNPQSPIPNDRLVFPFKELNIIKKKIKSINGK